MIRALLVVAACLLPGCMGGGCSTPDSPSAETCDDPPDIAPAVSRIEIGHIDDDRFVVIQPGSVVPLVIGGQGSDMIVAALRITGSGLTSCIAQRTELSFMGEPMSSESSPMSATQLSPAVWQTGVMFLPWYNATSVEATLTSTVGTLSASVSFWIAYQPEVDAAIPPDGWVQDDAPNDAPIPIDAVIDAP